MPSLLRSARPLVASLILMAIVLGCRPASGGTREILVGGTDYAFDVPAEIPAGTTHLRFVNRGRVPHEMALGQLHAGVTADSVLAYAAAGHDLGDLATIVGILIANPGDTAIGTLGTDLVPGRTYMMICGFQDADSLPPHLAMGMVAGFVAKEP